MLRLTTTLALKSYGMHCLLSFPTPAHSASSAVACPYYRCLPGEVADPVEDVEVFGTENNQVMKEPIRVVISRPI